jgi:putative transposase
MTHVKNVKTSPCYPQSNGKIERWHQSIKQECIRPLTPLSLDEGIKIVGEYVSHYNNVRLHSAIGYIAPVDKLEGRSEMIGLERNEN